MGEEILLQRGFNLLMHYDVQLFCLGYIRKYWPGFESEFHPSLIDSELQPELIAIAEMNDRTGSFNTARLKEIMDQKKM